MKYYFSTTVIAAVVALSIHTADARSYPNIALGKPVTTSSMENQQLSPQMAVDGDRTTRWSSQFSDHHWITVDLQARYNLSEVKLHWQNSYSTHYDIKVSDDGTNWRTVESVMGSDGGLDRVNLSGSEGRFVRVEGNQRATRWGHSLWELEIHGSPVADNISHYKPVSASSTENNSLVPEYAVDGDPDTRWSSEFTDREWLEVDFGAECEVTFVRLHWQNSYSRDYQLQTSYDGERWTTIGREKDSDGRLDELAVQGHGRYLRVKGSRRATEWGHSLWELEVFGYATSDAVAKSEQNPGHHDEAKPNRTPKGNHFSQDADEPLDAERQGAVGKDPHDMRDRKSYAVVTGPFRLEWQSSDRRENGDYLAPDEIAGYELRYRRRGQKEPAVIVVEDSFATSYPFERLNGLYHFSIAVFDTNGLYSEFVDLEPVKN